MAKDKDKTKNELHDGDVNDGIVETREDELDERTEPKGGKATGKEGEVTEPESVASVEKTEKQGKKTSLPNGGKGQGSKTKAGMINTMYKKFSGMKKEELEHAFEQVMGESVEGVEDTEVEVPDTKEELSKLVESEETLSEDFKAKASVLFETALNATIAEHTERLDEEYKEKLDEAVKEHQETLASQMDSYLGYVVETWMKENEVAINNGLRTEIAEDFMKKLHGLFEESYISVPESKVDLVDELSEDNKELESQLNETTESLITKTTELEELKKEKIIRESCKDLADTQVEKVSKLLESVDFEDEESFKNRVETVKESYFKKDDKKTSSKTDVITEDLDEEDEDETKQVSAEMNKYIHTLKRIAPKTV